MGKSVRKAVFPVAGLGTRVLPMTKVLPKEMLPLVDRPLLQNAVEEARAAGIEEFCFVSSRGKAVMEDHFDMHPELYSVLESRGKAEALDEARRAEIASSMLTIVRQHQPLGLGHAIWCAKDFVGNEPFAILLADDVVLSETACLAQMMEQYHMRGGNMVAVVEVPRDQTNKYGILDVGHDDGTLAEIKGLVEKPDPAEAPSTLSIIGRYILQPEIFGLLESQETGAGGEIQLTDAMARLIGSQPFHGVRYEGTRFDCGDKAGMIAANVAFALQRDDLKDSVKTLIKPLLD